MCKKYLLKQVENSTITWKINDLLLGEKIQIFSKSQHFDVKKKPKLRPTNNFHTKRTFPQNIYLKYL